MSTQNLYLKQISCLVSPVRNHGWHEIAQHCPAALHCLVEAEPELVFHEHEPAIAIQEENDQNTSIGEPIDVPIPWYEICESDDDPDDGRAFQLERFFYDCSYLSPFVGNVYAREQSAKGWYRWVGPEPVLQIKLPLAPVATEQWIFKATFHAFLEDSHSQELRFEVNGKTKPLEWIEGSIYQSQIQSSELYRSDRAGEVAIVSLAIGVPEARQASEADQRLLAFAIRELTLFPA
jgi:hypothetical protein